MVDVHAERIVDKKERTRGASAKPWSPRSTRVFVEWRCSSPVRVNAPRQAARLENPLFASPQYEPQCDWRVGRERVHEARPIFGQDGEEVKGL